MFIIRVAYFVTRRKINASGLIQIKVQNSKTKANDI